MKKTTVTTVRYTEFFGRGRKKQILNEKSGRKYNNLYSIGREKSEVFMENVSSWNSSIQAPRKKIPKTVTTTKILNPPLSHPSLSPALAHFPPVDFEIFNNAVSFSNFRFNWVSIITSLLTVVIYV